jgi:hypothetical protein
MPLYRRACRVWSSIACREELREVASRFPAQVRIKSLPKDGAMGSISVACYKPKAGCEAALLELVRAHLPPLRAQGLVTDRVRSSRYSSGCLRTPSLGRMRIPRCWICGSDLNRSARTRYLPTLLSFKICLRTLHRSEHTIGRFSEAR